MPFFSLNQKLLLQKLNICNQVSPKKSEVEMFTFTKVEVKDGVATFSAINTNIFYQTQVKIQNLDLTENISFLIKTDVFASSVGLIIDENVGLEANFDKSTLLVQGAKSKHTLRIDTSNLDRFTLPEHKSDNILAQTRIITSDLLNSIKTSQISVGLPKNIYQPEFLNICFTLRPEEEKILIVSTDRYRITRNVNVANFSQLSQEFKERENHNFLINPKSLQLLNSIDDTEKSIELSFEKDFLWINFEESKLVLKYGEGKYPDYDKIIPQTFTCSYLANTKDLLNSLKQVYLFARTNAINRSVSLKVDPKENKITFSAQTQDGYASESSMDIENYEGVQEEWTQAFNADYLIDYINISSQSKVLWEANPGKPSVLSPENKKAEQLYLVSGLK
ncbi:MAG: DNA polymerase III subunit beta [Patescibacteria group bacterium]